MLSSRKNMKKHSQMVWQYNVSKATQLTPQKHMLNFSVQNID